jgi:hypothetical protein
MRWFDLLPVARLWLDPAVPDRFLLVSSPVGTRSRRRGTAEPAMLQGVSLLRFRRVGR